MAKERVKPLMSSFTSKGEFFAALLSNGIVKVWNTSDGSLLAEWKQPEGDSDVQFSCIACSFVGKKRRKEQGTCWVALGTNGGEVLAINANAGELKWKSSGHNHGIIAALSFANKGNKLRVIGTDGTTCEMNSETGELIKETKIPKKFVSTSVYISDDKILAAANTKIRVLCIEDGKELLKFSTGAGPVQHMSILDNTNVVITSGFDDKNLQVWRNESSTGIVCSGPVLSMRHPPVAIECKNGCDGEDDLAVLALSESGIAYVWNLKTFPEAEGSIVPTRIKVDAREPKTDPNYSGKTKRSRASILAARLNSGNNGDHISVLTAYGSINLPQFCVVDIATPGEDIMIDAGDDVQEKGVNNGKEAKDIRGKKRAASDTDAGDAGLNLDGDPMDRVQIDNDIDEPTMGEKLASLNLMNNEGGIDEKADTSLAKPPSADSVHVLLKQALHADDRSLLLDCLFRQDEKVIANSVSLLNPSDVFKLLESLISLIQSRGAVLACALPWLKGLLLQHASSIMCQESSLMALNSLYQLVESRVSTFNPALQLSSCLDLLYTKTIDDGADEGEGSFEPIIYEDVSDEEGSGEDDDAMETDEEGNDELEAVSNVSDLEGSDGMSD